LQCFSGTIAITLCSAFSLSINLLYDNFIFLNEKKHAHQ
jgi:hypothetical protein